MRPICGENRNNTVCTRAPNHGEGNMGDPIHLGLSMIYPFYVTMWEDHGLIVTAESFDKAQNLWVKMKGEATR